MKANACLFVLARSETTATLLGGATYYLLKDKPRLEKLVKEIRGTSAPSAPPRTSTPQTPTYPNASSHTPTPSYDLAYTHDNKSIVNPFSIGPRNCVGQHLAIVEMRLILSRLLWNFNLELMPESEGWTDQKVLVIWHKEQLMVRVRERKGEGR